MTDLAAKNLLAEPNLLESMAATGGVDRRADVFDRLSRASAIRWFVRVATRRSGQLVAVGAGLVGALGIAISAVAVAPQAPTRPLSWWFTLPADWLRALTAMATLFYASLVLLVLAWLMVGLGVRARCWRVGGLRLLAGLWSAPLLLAPVTLSTDVYTYLGQGLVTANGLNPYQYGPVFAALPGRLAQGMSPAWLATPCPYGPAFAALAGLIAPLARTHLVYAVVAMRLVEVAGLALIAWGLPRLARALGADPVRATWLGITSPLVLGSFVLSGHNDALMVGLMICGLAVATRTDLIGRVPPALVAVALCALAAMVKAPAAMAVVFLAVAWAAQRDTWRARAARMGMCAGVALAVLAVVTWLAGFGWSWLDGSALSSPTRVSTPFTPARAMSLTAAFIAQNLGIPLPLDLVIPVVLTVTATVAVLFAAGLLVRHRRIGMARALGLTLLVVVLASPITWPWYLCWSVVLLAAAMPGRRMLGLIALGALPLLLIAPDGTSQPFGVVSIVLFAVLSLLGIGYLVYWSYRNLVRSPPPRRTAGAVRVKQP